MKKMLRIVGMVLWNPVVYLMTAIIGFLLFVAAYYGFMSFFDYLSHLMMPAALGDVRRANGFAFGAILAILPMIWFFVFAYIVLFVDARFSSVFIMAACGFTGILGGLSLYDAIVLHHSVAAGNTWATSLPLTPFLVIGTVVSVAYIIIKMTVGIGNRIPRTR